MRPFLLFISLLEGTLFAQLENSQITPARVEYEKHVPPLPLRKMVDAAILMLEARAYEQFIRTFVAESDRRKFEKAYTREDRVDYERWGEEKAGKLLNNLRSLAAAEAVVKSTKVCYYKPGERESFFSFVRQRGMWLIENNPRCLERKEVKSSAQPQVVP